MHREELATINRHCVTKSNLNVPLKVGHKWIFPGHAGTWLFVSEEACCYMQLSKGAC